MATYLPQTILLCLYMYLGKKKKNNGQRFRLEVKGDVCVGGVGVGVCGCVCGVCGSVFVGAMNNLMIMV